MTDKKLSDFLPSNNYSYFNKNEKYEFPSIVSKEQIIIELKKVMDPEIPVNLYDLGLIYTINIDSISNVEIEMTLTNPNCPVAGTMPESVGKSVETINSLASIKVSLVWDPKWDKDMMSEDAKLALDIF